MNSIHFTKHFWNENDIVKSQKLFMSLTSDTFFKVHLSWTVSEYLSFRCDPGHRLL